MKASGKIDEALDGLPAEGGEAKAVGDDGRAQVDVVEVGRLGVRVRSVEVHHREAVDIAHEAATLPGRLRTLPDRVQPVEVDPGLGGAILRSRPEDMRKREFYEVDVTPNRTAIRKQRIDDGGDRQVVDFTLTREQLRGLLDEAAVAPEPEKAPE